VLDNDSTAMIYMLTKPRGDSYIEQPGKEQYATFRSVSYASHFHFFKYSSLNTYRFSDREEGFDFLGNSGGSVRNSLTGESSSLVVVLHLLPDEFKAEVIPCPDESKSERSVSDDSPAVSIEIFSVIGEQISSSTAGC
jgi:hypothetical protein